MADILMSAPLFVALNDDAAGALRASMVEVTFPKGGVIFSEGDGGDRLYVVLEGKVKLGVSSSDGRENLLSVQGPGEMFGELSLFDPGPRTATANAEATASVSPILDRLKKPNSLRPTGIFPGIRRISKRRSQTPMSMLSS